MKKWFAFKVRSGKDLRGKDTYYWIVTSKYASKKEVLAEYNTKGYARKVTTVYTLEQLVETFGKSQAKQILEKTKPHWVGELNRGKYERFSN